MIATYFNLVASSGSVVCPDGGSSCSTGLPNVSFSGSEVQTILQILFGIIGGLAVLFIIIGGFRMTISSGDPEDVSKAKSTILYALIGLIVSISAELLIGFVMGNLP